MNEKQPRLYRTSDLGLATHLVIKGMRLVSIRPPDGRTAEFALRDAENRRSLVLNFLNRSASVDPSTYLDRLRRLKAAVSECRINSSAGASHG